MRNQVVLWATLVVPWLSLFFMKKEDIKRYMPVSMLQAIISMVLAQIGLTLKWWALKETIYPLMLPVDSLGLFAVVNLWLFKFTFRKFWLYLAVEIVINFGFNTLYLSLLLPYLGINENSQNPFIGTLMTTVVGLILYVYQLWQQSIYAEPVRKKNT